MSEVKHTLMFYINTIRGGGAARVMVQLAGRFRAEGYRTILVTSFREDVEYPVPEGVERIDLEEREMTQSRIRKNLSRISKLRALIRQHRPDVLISFMAEPNFRAVMAGVGLPVKVIVSVRCDPNEEYRKTAFRFVGKHILPRADGCVFQTYEAAEWFPEDMRKRSAVIMNQVAERFFDTGLKENRSGIVTTGRLDKQKNHEMLIRAFSRIADKTEDDLYIYGVGDMREYLRSLAVSLGVGERVYLPGGVNNVPEVLSEAKIFVLSSDYEGMPNSLLEALAMGLPCISTDCPCGGPRQVIEDGVNGLLVPVGDEDAVAEAMLKLLSDSEAAEAMGQEAKKMAESFRPEKVFADWKTYIEGIIDR